MAIETVVDIGFSTGRSLEGIVDRETKVVGIDARCQRIVKLCNMLGGPCEVILLNQVAHDLRIGAAISPRPMASLLTCKELERGGVHVLTYARIVDQCSIDIPQDQNHSGTMTSSMGRTAQPQ